MTVALANPNISVADVSLEPGGSDDLPAVLAEMEEFLAGPGGQVGPLAPDEQVEMAESLRAPASKVPDRLEQQQLVGRLNAALTKNMTRTFAGLWIDNAADGSLHLAFTADAGGTTQRLLDVLPGIHSIVAHDAAYSYQQLKSAVLALIEVGDAVAAQKAPGEPFNRGFDVDIAVERNEVVIFADQDVPTEIDSLIDSGPEGLYRRQLGDAVSQPTDCTSRTNCFPLRGGIRVANSDGGYCTSGFSVAGASGTSEGLVGAGHCPLTNRYHSGEYIGKESGSK